MQLTYVLHITVFILSLLIHNFSKYWDKDLIVSSAEDVFLRINGFGGIIIG